MAHYKKSDRQDVAPLNTVPFTVPAKSNLSQAPASVTLNSQTNKSNDADVMMMTWSSADEGTLNVGDRTFMVP